MSVPVPHRRTAVLSQQTAPARDVCAARRTPDGAADVPAHPLPTADAMTAAIPGARRPEKPADNGSGPGLTVLLIGDDPSSTVPDMWDWAGRKVRLRTARNLTEAARLLTDDVDCLLLDLAPATEADVPADGADTLGALHAVLRMAPAHAVLVMTPETDAERAAEAVRVGAQDYLFRDELDGAVLSRAVRYAVERKRADLAQRQLTESRMRAQENARLERGLLPSPVLDDERLSASTRYRVGGKQRLLGGDFYDLVQTPDGWVHGLIGDVCGHGPSEAALGVCLPDVRGGGPRYFRCGFIA